jgi:hypothetical protein
MSSFQPGPSLPAIQAALSAPRFQPYLDAAGQSPQLALELYEWNLELSAAFWEVIAVVEVVTRNAMHDQLTSAYGARWYDNTAIVDDRSLNVIREAKRRASRGIPKSTPLSPGKVVSEMSFGAWVSLLDQGGYSTAQRRRLRYHDTLWLPALQHAFPNGPAHQKKTNRGLRTVQSLRNRIGHHEKIFHEPFKDTQLTLQALHSHCLEVTGWVSPDAEAWVAASSRVVAVLAQRPAGT